jgi:serine/threonine-protein kinase
MLERLEDGTILRGRYKVNNLVGHGGMGNVYRAEDLRLPGRLCAIKEVQPEEGASPEARKQEQAQFLREASLLARLDHPNLPKVSDFFTEAGRDYLVMDYVPGKNLKEILDESLAAGHTLDVDMVMRWADQLLASLIYLHNQDPPVLHRDIKPANIKLTPDDRIKLVDFGLVKLLASDDSQTITVIQGRGTAYYTPLEQYGAESEHTGIHSDLYAFGATFYHLLTGKPPPEAKERFLSPGIMRPLKEVNRKVSLEMSDAVEWAVEMHPDDRPDNAAMLKQAVVGDLRRPTRSNSQAGEGRLLEVLQANWIIALLALGLFLLAIALTLF